MFFHYFFISMFQESIFCCVLGMVETLQRRERERERKRQGKKGKVKIKWS